MQRFNIVTSNFSFYLTAYPSMDRNGGYVTTLTQTAVHLRYACAVALELTRFAHRRHARHARRHRTSACPLPHLTRQVAVSPFFRLPLTLIVARSSPKV